MTMHQCPKCELRFTWQTELDDHCRTDHPQFHHDYPVHGVHHDDSEASVQHVEEKQPEPAPAEAKHADNTSAILKTWWSER
jgi:hypothetical protein